MAETNDENRSRAFFEKKEKTPDCRFKVVVVFFRCAAVSTSISSFD